jgi:hypothetical protein
MAPMNTPNWQKHSNKQKKTKGLSKGKIKARKQSLKAILNKYGK